MIHDTLNQTGIHTPTLGGFCNLEFPWLLEATEGVGLRTVDLFCLGRRAPHICYEY